MKFKVLDLFSGIGGFSYGLEKLGCFETVAFCEIDKDCVSILNKHWPSVPVHKGVEGLSYDSSDIDIICGGFPCQDISVGGAQKGIVEGSRSSLWKEYRRLINEIRPKYVIVENVERLRKNGLGVVLNDLHQIGYDAEWDCVTASSLGYPHQRDRLWLIAYPCVERLHEHTKRERYLQIDKERESEETHPQGSECESEPVPFCKVLSRGFFDSKRSPITDKESIVSTVRRVTDGVPEGLDEKRRKIRIKQLGNSIVPEMAKIIGEAILNKELL